MAQEWKLKPTFAASFPNKKGTCCSCVLMMKIILFSLPLVFHLANPNCTRKIWHTDLPNVICSTLSTPHFAAVIKISLSSHTYIPLCSLYVLACEARKMKETDPLVMKKRGKLERLKKRPFYFSLFLPTPSSIIYYLG